MPSRSESSGPSPETSDLKTRSRADYVYLMIREAIRTRRYGPGDRLREAEVAGWLGVSRTPVREAVSRLTAERLLVESQSRGITVAELEQRQVRELYALRENLEGMAAGLAAVHASTDEIEALSDILAEAKRRFDDPEAQHALNAQLHAAICEAANNRYLAQALNKLDDSLDLLQGTTFQVPGRAPAAYEEHARIVAAIAAGDADAAEAAAREHMRNACRVRIRQIFGPKL
jgi:DNA-binding GntR family transcriptional regulator